MTAPLGTRLPTLEWSYQSASGKLDGVQWVDTRLDVDLTPLAMSTREDRGCAFRAVRHMDWLPPVVLDDALAAQASGVVTGWEVLEMIVAPIEWAIASRKYFWRPISPFPKLLASLVETYGVEEGIHRHDGERLSRLAALLPGWHPYRGSLSRARQVLDTVDEGDLLDRAASLEAPALHPTLAPELDEEVFACHRADWWEHRQAGTAEPLYRIDGGFLRYQPTGRDKFRLQREDILFLWQPGRSLPQHAVRLLPTWVCFRLAVKLPKKLQADAADKAAESKPAGRKKRGGKKTKAAKAADGAAAKKTSAKAEAADTRPRRGKAMAKSTASPDAVDTETESLEPNAATAESGAPKAKPAAPDGESE